MASLLSFTILPKPNLTKVACSSSSTATTLSPPEILTLDQKFGRKGIKFSDSGDVELTVRNGSSLKLRIPDGHITSYKPKVYWKDDGFEEILYTLPGNDIGSSVTSTATSATKAKGGIGLVINNVNASDRNSRPSHVITSEWSVKDVDSDSIDAVQVELSCTSGTLDLTYIVSLYPLSMATAVIVKNNGGKAVNLTGAILSHFKFKKRSGTGIQGLQGCSYCTHPPLSSPFEILSPAETMKTEDPAWFSFTWEPEKKPGVWTTQDVPITILKNKLSRVYSVPPSERSKQFYTTAPTKYETLDQGRELFFRVIRIGFEDIYVSSPGSLSKKYGEDYFICTGSGSLLVPVVVNPVQQHTSINTKKRYFPLPGVASIPYPVPAPINVDYLESEFSSHGVTFEDISDSCVVKMGLENGSLATVMLPSGMITSYKASMWHGGLLELLHTSVSEGEDGSDPVIQGGVSLAFKIESDDDGGVSWSPNTWALRDVRGNPDESIQVELVSSNSEGMIEVKHILTLQQDLLSSELVFSNSKSSPLRLLGSIVSHLTVSTPDATYALGLERSNFHSRPPFLSNFSIIPPESGRTKDFNLWNPFTVEELSSTWGAGKQNNAVDTKSREREEDPEGEEDDNNKQLTEKMSRVYTSAPRDFIILDRGRRNSVVVQREGFNELYMFSPGSAHEWYGKYAYICVGQSALLKPIILGPKSVWRGTQHLHNPNL
ncbi:hypothetical protein RHGRI_006190 [Rhododendron griersonianum]|uniref:NDH-dependent cyclic electron flow 5 n=1 Tax=Rhododendron griersonianum TaxID=479676 RepID=A0AAV6KSL7_9ERIC|nr:hypothetical protein RHGRI_006190 [Rhododendron griersonianum]